MDTESQKSLRAYQLNLLPLLQEFDEFCKKHKITYFLVGGSALGAVRHQGFIPWDDDIDVGLSRKDLTRLEELLQTEKPKHWTFESCDKHSIPHPPFAFLSFEQPLSQYREKLPCIDIFPLDGVPENTFLQQIQKYASYVYHLSILKQVPQHRGKWAAGLVRMALIFTPAFVWRILATLSRKIVTHWAYESNRLIANIFGMAGYQKEIMPRSFLGGPQLAKFESIALPVPEEVDAYLTHLYGNYMQPPPKEEQKPHHVIIY